VFLNNRNDVNPDAQNEKILSYELGYGFRNSKLNATRELIERDANHRAPESAAVFGDQKIGAARFPKDGIASTSVSHEHVAR
jgi:hypothetical protein